MVSRPHLLQSRRLWRKTSGPSWQETPLLRLSSSHPSKATSLTQDHPYLLTVVHYLELQPGSSGARDRSDGDSKTALRVHLIQLQRHDTIHKERQVGLLLMTPVTLRQSQR